VEEAKLDEDRAFLLNGVMHGFDIIDPLASLKPAYHPNHKSVCQNVDVANDLVMKEVTKGNYVVCDDNVALPTIISPLGLVPKSDGGYRLIHDCSMPTGKCLNDYAWEFDKCTMNQWTRLWICFSRVTFLPKWTLKAACRGVAIDRKSVV
jgi:hypothetical protein